MPVADIKSEDNTETRVLIAPTDALKRVEDESVKILKLRHPRTNSGTYFLYNSVEKTLLEIMSFNEEHRSWFIGSKVVGDGRMLLGTPVNPLFLLLPYMRKSEKLVPLDQMIEDEDYPETENILIATLNDSKLSTIADSKGTKDLNVWKFNEEKTLSWLEKKVRSLAAVFEETSVDLSEGAASTILKSGGAGEDHQYLRFSFGVLQEYLSPPLAAQLEERLDLPKEEVKAGSKRLSTAPADEEENKPSKRVKLEGPSEDYSQGAKKIVVKEETSAKQKALAQSAKGTKSIMSFFGKK